MQEKQEKIQEQEGLWSRERLAGFIGLTPQTVSKRLKNNPKSIPPCRRFGSRAMWLEEVVMAWCKEHSVYDTEF